MPLHSWYKLFLKVAIVVLAILIGFFFIAPIFGFDLMKYLSVVPTNLEGIYQPTDLSTQTNYEGYELSHEGMILKRDGGEDNITKVLETRVTATDCKLCSSCIRDPNFNAYYCECKVCGGKSIIPEDVNGDCVVNITDVNLCKQHYGENWPPCDLDNDGKVLLFDEVIVLGAQGKTCSNMVPTFKNCSGCNITTNECLFCDDTRDEYLLCKEIKTCILDYYGDKDYKEKHGCFITEIPYNDNVLFDINKLRNILSSCDDQSIKVNMGNNISRELCYFDSSSISYYDLKRPNDFYMNYKIISYPPIGQTFLFWAPFDNKINLLPFYKEGGNTIQKYRVYVALNSSVDTSFDVYVGHYHQGFDTGVPDDSDHECKIGTIKTDSTGFGHGEFADLSNCDQAVLQKWKENPEKYTLNGAKIFGPGGPSGYVPLNVVVAIFYSNTPESNGAWTNELRYPNSNFNTNPEPYLKDRPSWAHNPDNLNSSWFLTYGSPDSSVKVFYDSSMSGGGNSKNRGNIKIQLGRLDTNSQRNCKFDIYVSSQDAFAEYDGEGILSLADFFTNFNPTNVYSKTSSGNKNIILYNSFEFNLDKNYTIEEIKSAIKTGFRLWEQNTFLYINTGYGSSWLNNNEGIYEDTWKELYGPIYGTQYGQDCWNNNVRDYLNNNNERAIIGYCPGGICQGSIKFRIAFKYMDSSAILPLYPLITFCGYTPSSNCGNNITEYPPEKCDGTDLGGQTCESLGFSGGGTLKCTGSCTFDTSGCTGYMNYQFKNPESINDGVSLCGQVTEKFDGNINSECVGDDSGNDYCLKGVESPHTVSALHLVSYAPNCIPPQHFNPYIFESYGDKSHALECCWSDSPGHYQCNTGFSGLYYGTVNATSQGWSNDNILKLFRQAWCNDPANPGADIDCLLCYNDIKYGGQTSAFYVCKGKPSGTPGAAPETATGGVNTYSLIVNISTGQNVGPWRCNSDGRWTS